jgi:hypothetical protein
MSLKNNISMQASKILSTISPYHGKNPPVGNVLDIYGGWGWVGVKFTTTPALMPIVVVDKVRCSIGV